MPAPNIVVLADRNGRGSDFVQAGRVFACCRLANTSDDWNDVEKIDGMIVDISINRTDSVRCLERFRNCLGDRKIPIFFVLPSCNHLMLKLAGNLGATACFSPMSGPISVLSALFRQINPEKTMTDLLVESSVARCGSLFISMFEAGRIGILDGAAIDDAGDAILQALRDGGLRRWLDLIQAHDDMTVRHCLLVAGLVANFAIHLGLSVDDRTKLVRAGLVHDVGKAQIPLSILNKPDRLDAEEMALMRLHAARGYDILLASGIREPIVLAATRHHHEMLDGSGYPDGLRDGQIGDAVRLLTVCDIYAALTERRPYRAPLPEAEALQILRGMAPQKLERTVVEAFAASLGQDKPALLGCDNKFEASHKV